MVLKTQPKLLILHVKQKCSTTNKATIPNPVYKRNMKFHSVWRLKQLWNKRVVTYRCSVRCTKTSSSSAIYKIPHSCKLLSQKREKKNLVTDRLIVCRKKTKKLSCVPLAVTARKQYWRVETEFKNKQINLQLIHHICEKILKAP